MQGINQLINKLNTDQRTAVSVINPANGDILARNYTADKILQYWTTLEDFFKNVPDDYDIIEKRLSGTVVSNGKRFPRFERKKIVRKALNNPNTPTQLILFPNEKNKPKTNVMQTPTIPQPTYVVPPMQGLNAPMQGLGLPELISLNVDRVDKQRLLSENAVLKSENERLKKVEDEYKEYKLSVEYSDKKSQNNQDMISSFLSSPVIVSIAQKLLAPKDTMLNAPALPQDEFVSKYLQLSEGMQNLFKNVMYLAETKEGFIQNLIDFTQQQNRQEDENQTDTDTYNL